MYLYAIAIIIILYIPVFINFSFKKLISFSTAYFLFFLITAYLGHYINMNLFGGMEDEMEYKIDFVFRVVSKVHVLSCFILFLVLLADFFKFKTKSSRFDIGFILLSGALIFMYLFTYFFVGTGGRIL